MGCLKLSIRRSRKVLQVVKMDGKIIEFKAPVLVKELLVKYKGFGVKSSRKSSEELAPSYELQLGRIYHLFRKEFPVPAADGGSTAAVKRIKVVITKKQLEELLSKKTSMEKIIFGIDKACPTDLAINWKPNLAPIAEENELNV